MTFSSGFRCVCLNIATHYIYFSNVVTHYIHFSNVVTHSVWFCLAMFVAIVSENSLRPDTAKALFHTRPNCRPFVVEVVDDFQVCTYLLLVSILYTTILCSHLPFLYFYDGSFIALYFCVKVIYIYIYICIYIKRSDDSYHSRIRLTWKRQHIHNASYVQKYIFL